MPKRNNTSIALGVASENSLKDFFVQPVLAILALVIILMCGGYFYLVAATAAERVQKIDHTGLVSEGLLCGFVAVSLFGWSQFEGRPITRWTMFVGLALALAGFTTDVLDEIVVVSLPLEDWLEGYAISIAFGLISFGVLSWIREWKLVLSEAKRLAAIDSLTGAANRSFFLTCSSM